MTVTLKKAVLVGAVVAIPLSVGLAAAMHAVHARTKITRMKRIIDRLVWPMTNKEFAEMQLTWSAFTQKFYGNSGNFMSHDNGAASVSPEFKAKLEDRLGIKV